MSRFERMAIFTQVVDSQSFTATARKLGLSTAAVSKQVTQLESEIEIQLLQRTTRRIELTEPGRLFYERCLHLLQNYEETQNFAALLKGEPRGDLRVVATRYFGETFILPYLKSFLKLYPKLDLDLELAERIPNLSREKVDILFGLSLPGEPEWMQKPIAKTRYLFCASPEYLKERGVPKNPQDLLEHAYIAHIMRKPHKLLSFKNGVKVSLKHCLTLNDTKAMLECALAGMGVVRLHHYMVAEALQKKRLVEVLKDEHEGETPVYIYFQASQFVQPNVRKFIDYFSAKVSSSFQKLARC